MLEDFLLCPLNPQSSPPAATAKAQLEPKGFEFSAEC